MKARRASLSNGANPARAVRAGDGGLAGTKRRKQLCQWVIHIDGNNMGSWFKTHGSKPNLRDGSSGHAAAFRRNRTAGNRQASEATETPLRPYLTGEPFPAPAADHGRGRHDVSAAARPESGLRLLVCEGCFSSDQKLPLVLRRYRICPQSFPLHVAYDSCRGVLFQSETAGTRRKMTKTAYLDFQVVQAHL